MYFEHFLDIFPYLKFGFINHIPTYLKLTDVIGVRHRSHRIRIARGIGRITRITDRYKFYRERIGSTTEGLKQTFGERDSRESD